MHQSISNDIQADHQHWLQDINRWQNYLSTWVQDKDEFVKAAKSFQDRIDHYCADLKAYGETLEAHRQEIVNAERLMVENAIDGDVVARELHSKRKRHHDALCRLQASLQNQYHALEVQLATLQPN